MGTLPENTVRRCSQCRGVGHNRTALREVGQFPIEMPTCSEVFFFFFFWWLPTAPKPAKNDGILKVCREKKTK